MIFLLILNMKMMGNKIINFKNNKIKVGIRPYRTFQHRGKISTKLKGYVMKNNHKNNIIKSISKKGVVPLITRKKISSINKGKKKSADVRTKISISLTGRKLSLEHINKLKNKLGGEKNPMFGKTHSIKSKRKISKSILGKYI